MNFRFKIDSGMGVTQIGYSVCKENWGIMNRPLPDNELIAVYAGSLFCNIGDVHYEIPQGYG